MYCEETFAFLKLLRCSEDSHSNNATELALFRIQTMTNHDRDLDLCFLVFSSIVKVHASQCVCMTVFQNVPFPPSMTSSP